MNTSVNEVTRDGKDYVGYDYKSVSTCNDNTSMYLDAYKNFGWIHDDSSQTMELRSPATLKLKRDRKILNKAELTRLGQHFEACMDDIASLEKSKTKTATVISVITGLIGTAFIAGSVMVLTLIEPPMILLCVILGVPGIIGWVLPLHLFKLLIKKRVEEVTPLIEQKYDEVHEICEKGNSLIH